MGLCAAKQRQDQDPKRQIPLPDRPLEPNTTSKTAKPRPLLVKVVKHEGRGPIARYEAPTAQVSKPELSSSELAEINSCLDSHYLFQGIPQSYKQRLVKRILIYTVKEGDIVVKEGYPAANLYILASGAVEISANEEFIRELNPVNCFGELALILNSTRTATVRTINSCKLYVIERQSFEIMMDEITEDNFASITEFVRQVPLFAGFDGVHTESLVRTCHLMFYSKGKVILREGEEGHLMYIIKKGAVNVIKNTVFIESFGKTDLFGEQSLLYNALRSATIVAARDCELLAITKDQLDALMPKISKPILYKHVLRVAFTRSQTLRRLRENQLDAVLKAIKVKSFSAGEVVIAKGVMEGSMMLIMLKGTLVVEGRTFKAYECIGDSGMRKQVQFPFKHEVVATDETCVGEISRDRFEKALGGSLAKKKQDIWAFFNSIPLFSNLQGEHMTHLINVSPRQSVQRYEYIEGEFLFMKGEPGDFVYFVESGMVSIILDSNVVMRFGPYDFLGERACMANTVRNASASASMPTVVWALSRSNLMKSLDKGRLKQLKQRIQFQDMRGLDFYQLKPVKLLTSKSSRSSFIIYSSSDSLITPRELNRPLDPNSKPKIGNLGYLKAYKISMLQSRRKYYARLKQSSLLGIEIDHPMAAKYIKSFKSNNYVFKLSQYIPGTNLQTLLDQEGYFSEAQIKDYVAQLLILLDYLHSRKILLRGIAPSNFIATGKAAIYLKNFEFAKRLEDRTYTLVKDPHYCSPEAITAVGYGLEADLWALGVTVYYLGFGIFPFGEAYENPMDIYQSIVEGDLQFPREVSSSLNFNNFIKSMLKPSLHFRCKTVKEAKDHGWLAGTLWVRLI